MKIELRIDNVYPDDTITNVRTIDVPEPEVEDMADNLEDWAYDHFFPETGTGREHGDAGYFVKVIACDDRPDLVDREFEWGT